MPDFRWSLIYRKPITVLLENRLDWACRVFFLFQMGNEWTLTQDLFETLPAWLAPEREIAGQKYETIRHRLIKNFYARGLQDAEGVSR